MMYYKVLLTLYIGFFFRPILIPDSWSYAIVKALMEAEFQCYVKLRDEEILVC